MSSPDAGVRPYFQPDGDPEQCADRTCTALPQGTVRDAHDKGCGQFCNKHGHLLVGKMRAAIDKRERAAR